MAENQEFRSSSNNNKNEGQETVGVLLKEKRISKNLSLQDISRRTKINLTLLQHLEEDQYQKLPHKAYVIGYIKSYAKEIGLDVIYCVKLFNQQFVKVDPTLAPVIEFPKMEVSKENKKKNEEKKESQLFKSMTSKLAMLKKINIAIWIEEIKSSLKFIHSKLNYLYIFSFLVIGISSAILIIYQQKAEKTVIPKEAIPSTSKESQKQVEVVAAAVVAPVEKKELLNLNDESILKPTQLAIKETKKEEKLKEEIKKEESKKEEKKELVVKKPNEIILAKKVEFSKAQNPLFMVKENPKQEEMDFLAPYAKSSFNSSKQNVFIFADKGDTWLTYKKDDLPIKKVLLAQGKGMFIQGDEVRLFFGNANAAKIFYNNKIITADSKNSIKSLVLPIENQSKYMLPLFVFPENGSVLTSDEYLNITKEETN